jgi:hypothetical protein
MFDQQHVHDALQHTTHKFAVHPCEADGGPAAAATIAAEWLCLNTQVAP